MRQASLPSRSQFRAVALARNSICAEHPAARNPGTREMDSLSTSTVLLQSALGLAYSEGVAQLKEGPSQTFDRSRQPLPLGVPYAQYMFVATNAITLLRHTAMLRFFGKSIRFCNRTRPRAANFLKGPHGERDGKSGRWTHSSLANKIRTGNLRPQLPVRCWFALTVLGSLFDSLMSRERLRYVEAAVGPGNEHGRSRA